MATTTTIGARNPKRGPSVREEFSIRGPVAALAIAAATLSGLAQAAPADFQYAARAGIAYSDNLGRTENNKISSASAVAGLQLIALRPTGRLTFNVAGDLSYYDYFEKSFKSEVLGQMQAVSAYQILPESLSWNAQASYGQVRQDVQLAASPNNREGLINFSTGPTLRAHFGSLLEGTLDLRYALADYTSNGLDNDTIGGNLILGHRPSANTLLALGFAYDDVSYAKHAGVPTIDFKRQEAFLRLDTKLVRTQLAADLGYSKVTGGGRDSTSPMLRVRATHRLSPFITAYVNFDQQYPTSQGAVEYDPAAAVTGADHTILTAAPRLTRNVGGGVIFARPRTQFELTFNRQDESAKLGAAGERTFDQFQARVSRAMTPRSTIGGFVGYTRETISPLTTSANETSVGAQLGLSFGKSLGLDVTVMDRRRTSAQAFNSFSELSGGIYLRYGRVRQQFAAPGAFQTQP